MGEHGDNTNDALTDPLLQQQQQNLDGEEDETHHPSNDDQQQQQQEPVVGLLAPCLDNSGSPASIVVGLLGLGVVGTVLGLVLPKNEALPTRWYRSVSSAIGYTYFACWSISFYPQVLINFSRKSTQGLSADFCGLNVIGFACYTAYNAAFFWSPYVQDQYRQRHGGDSITVQSNDVAFAVHALVLSCITLVQFVLYGDGYQSIRPSTCIAWVMRCIVLAIGAYAAMVVVNAPGCNWLDFLYLLSYIKIVISLIKYIPQVLLNYRRKSTRGWSIWNVLLDFSGGILSVLQLVLDCVDLNDFTGITGNLAKFGLGFVSILFDVIFILQHYVLYPDTTTTINNNDMMMPRHWLPKTTMPGMRMVMILLPYRHTTQKKTTSQTRK